VNTTAAGGPGKIIITGASTVTFYDNLTSSGASELRVSAGSRAVFLGNVTGTSHITGTGAKDFEGATNSPGPLLGGGDTIVGPSAALNSTLLRENSLDVEGIATLAIDPTDSHTTSRVGSLSIAGSTNAWL